MKSTITKTKTTTLAPKSRPTSAITRNSTKSSTNLTKSIPTHEEFKIVFKKKKHLTQKRFTSCVLTHISNKHLLVTAGDGQITLWDLNTFEPITTVKDAEINHICYLKHTGLVLGSSWESKQLKLWSVKNRDLKFHSRKYLDQTISCSVQLTKLDIICTANLKRELLFWGSRSGKNYFRFKIPNGLEIRAMTAIENKNSIAVGCKDGTLLLVNYLKKQVIQTLTLSFKLIIIMDLFPPYMAYNKASGHLFVGACNSNIEVLKITQNQDRVVSMKPVPHNIQQQGIRCLYCFEKEKIFISAHDNQFLRVWNAQKLEAIDTVPAKLSQAFCLSIDPQTKQIAVADFQSTSFSLLNY